MCYIHEGDVIRGTICSHYIDNGWYSDLASRNVVLEFDIITVPAMRYLAFAISSDNYGWEVLAVYDTTTGTATQSVAIPSTYDGAVKFGVKLYDSPPTVGSILNAGFDYVITGGIDVATPAKTKTVTITCDTVGAEIYYTIDGSEPTMDSVSYAGPFAVAHNLTVKAKAYKDGMVTSLSTSVFVETNVVINPVITQDGNSFTITCETEGASIYYTTDGSTPDATKTLYSGAVTLYKTSTVKAIGIKEEWTSSDVVEKTITVTLPAPTLSYELTEQDARISVTNTDAYSSYEDVSFECDGQTVAIGSLPIVVDGNGEWIVKASSPHCASSAGASIIVSGLKCATPTITQDWMTLPLEVTMSTTTNGARITYTQDGSEPSTDLSGGVDSPREVSFATPRVIKARAVKDRWEPSDVATADYSEQIATPSVSYDGELVTLSHPTADRLAYQSAGSSELVEYTAPFSGDGVTSLSAYAYEDGKLGNLIGAVLASLSGVVSNISDTRKRVTFTVQASDATVEDYLDEGVIRYTTDGSEPDEMSAAYGGPLTINESCTVKARYFGALINLNGWNVLISDSGVVSLEVEIAQGIGGTVGYNGDTIGYNGDEIGYTEE